MRTWIADPFDFDRPDAEERVHIDAAPRGRFPFPDVAAFVASAIDASTARMLPPPQPWSEVQGCAEIAAHLARFAGITLPEPCHWPTYVLPGDFDERVVVLCSPEGFIHYHWSTSA